VFSFLCRQSTWRCPLWAAWAPCCDAAAAERRRLLHRARSCRLISLARTALSSKPAARRCYRRLMGQIDRQAERWTTDRYIDPAPQTTRTASIIDDHKNSKVTQWGHKDNHYESMLLESSMLFKYLCSLCMEQYSVVNNYSKMYRPSLCVSLTSGWVSFVFFLSRASTFVRSSVFVSFCAFFFCVYYFPFFGYC